MLKKNAQVIIDTRMNNVPWTEITEENYLGYVQQYPDHAEDITRIAKGNAQGILTLEDLNGMSLGALKGLQGSLLEKQMGIANT